MIAEAYRCIMDEECVNFKEIMHDIIYKIEHDDELSDVDKELLFLHIDDIYNDICEVTP